MDGDVRTFNSATTTNSKKQKQKKQRAEFKHPPIKHLTLGDIWSFGSSASCARLILTIDLTVWCRPDPSHRTRVESANAKVSSDPSSNTRHPLSA